MERMALSHLKLDRHEISTMYFRTVHHWLPFLSQKRLSNATDSADEDSCEALLFLCMQLNILEFQEPPRTSMVYTVAKSLCAGTEANGVVSLRLLQSLVLLGIFELSHAVHPAAFLTIGKAARLGLVMGLQGPTKGQPLFKPADTWSLNEEMRRTWWAIFILDRYDVESCGETIADEI